MVDPSGSESTLDDLESATPASDDVGLGDTNVVVDDLVVTFRGVVVTKLSSLLHQRQRERRGMKRGRGDVRQSWHGRA